MADDLEISNTFRAYGDALRAYGKGNVGVRHALDELVEIMRPMLQQIAIAWQDTERWLWCIDSHSDKASSEPDLARKGLAVMGIDGAYRIVVIKTKTSESWSFDRKIEDATWKEADLLDWLPEFLERYASEVKKKSEINHLWLTEILRQAGMLAMQPKVNLGGSDR